jgi:low affinity Fe/Cu permease
MPRQRHTGPVLERVSATVTRWTGSTGAFALACSVVLVWGVTGPIFHYSDTWQLIINTSTTIVTFLMVFLLQNTQNRESRATQIKLDELLRAITATRTSLVDLEELPDSELDRLEGEFRTLSERAGTTRAQRAERRVFADAAHKARDAKAGKAADSGKAERRSGEAAGKNGGSSRGGEKKVVSAKHRGRQRKGG